MSTRPPPHTLAARIVVGISVLVVVVVVGVPLLSVFVLAFSGGVERFAHAVTTPDAIGALQLTLLTVAIVVPLNTAFGIAAAWALSKFSFRGRAVLLAIIDLPLAISPVVAGLLLVLVFGSRGLFGGVMDSLGTKVIFATPGIVLATMFVTLPFVAREVIPVMQSFGNDDEFAARALGAGGWHILRRITLPNVRWSVIYGALACAGRSVGEFGAVSVVSGHIRGETNTLSLHVEALYNEYDQVGAFSIAALLASFSIFALAARKIVEARVQRRGSTASVVTPDGASS
jgi:sulfate/thiosulfate transport system permease protein